MQFISSLFNGNSVLTAVFALGIVVVLIVIGVWLLKLLSNVSGNAVRGRNRRLAVIDTLGLDQKRQLVIIRRDNVEHLILTGGPQDLVIETGIPVEDIVAQQPTRRTTPPLPARRPMPKPAAPVVPEAAAAAPTGAPGTVLEHLQRAGHSGDRKTRVSLRHTGLLRPVDAQEPANAGQNADISRAGLTDSAKEFDSNRDESSALEHDSSSEPNRG